MKRISRKEDPQCFSRPLTQNPTKGEKRNQNYTFCPFFLKKGLEIQDFSTVKYKGRNNTFFPENCKSGDSPGKSNNQAYKDDKIMKTIYIYILITYFSWAKALHLHCFVEHGMRFHSHSLSHWSVPSLPKGCFQKWWRIAQCFAQDMANLDQWEQMQVSGGQLHPHQCHHHQHSSYYILGPDEAEEGSTCVYQNLYAGLISLREIFPIFIL